VANPTRSIPPFEGRFHNRGRRRRTSVVDNALVDVVREHYHVRMRHWSAHRTLEVKADKASASSKALNAIGIDIVGVNQKVGNATLGEALGALSEKIYCFGGSDEPMDGAGGGGDADSLEGAALGSLPRGADSLASS